MAITGGTGVVGAAVLRHLVESGDEVRGLSRSQASDGAVATLGARPVRGDVLDHSALLDAFSGCEIVYHVAGINEMCSTDPDRMYRVNVEGSRNVVRACAAAGVRRLVYTSSAVTIGEEAGVRANEETPHRGTYLSAYERSKHHAERVVFAERTPVEVVAVNPSSVQGPGRATGTGGLILDVLAGRLPFLIEATVSMVDIDDCARGHLLAARNGVPGRRYILSGFTTTVSEAVEGAAAVLGRPVEVRLAPIWLVRAAVATVHAGARMIGRRLPVCPEMIRVVSHGTDYDGSLAERELNLEYTPADETISRMVNWFRDQGLL
ncbi:MAG: NAD-dependent epimerase/dehydratase family protein [Acidimicrobiia bacterium]